MLEREVFIMFSMGIVACVVIAYVGIMFLMFALCTASSRADSNAEKAFELRSKKKKNVGV